MSRAPTVSTVSIGVLLVVVLAIAGTFSGPLRQQDVFACISLAFTLAWCWCGERRIERMAAVGDWHSVARASGVHFGVLLIGALATFLFAAWEPR